MGMEMTAPYNWIGVRFPSQDTVKSNVLIACRDEDEQRKIKAALNQHNLVIDMFGTTNIMIVQNQYRDDKILAVVFAPEYPWEEAVDVVERTVVALIGSNKRAAQPANITFTRVLP